MKTIIQFIYSRKQRFLSAVVLLILLISSNRLLAAEEQSINSSTVTAGTSFWVYDTRYSDMILNPTTWQTSFTNKKITDVIRLSTVEGLTANFEVKVNVTVLSYKWNPLSSSFTTSSVTTDLIVGSSVIETNTVNDKQALILQDAHAMKVTINSVVFLSGTTAASNLMLTSEIIADRQYFINSTQVASLGHLPSSVSGIASASELDLSWDYKTGAEWYELEYVHISKIGASSLKDMQPNELAYNYYMNSTRVEVKGNHYTIPKVYDRGYVIYRVRAIGFNGSTYNTRFESDWTAPESGTISTHPAANIIHIQNDYDPQMNWAHSASFAEEGKRSDVVQYADGMGRARQSVASNPVTNQVVVSNIYYDEMGRPVAGDLPTPVDQIALNHQPNFNQTNDGTSFQYSVFDQSTVGCSAVPTPFSTNFGAGKYYSANNPDKAGANAGIPDAEGFPYGRITYKNDLLNRVDKQGATGGTLMTNGGKEMRVIDLASDQLELNMLFGSDIGWASHYRKTALVDQNGQAAISYTDMAGRTVATYLTGSAPASLDALPENTLVSETKDLIVNGIGDVTSLTTPSSSLSYPKLITNSGNYTFNYRFTPEEYSKVCGSNAVCLDCVYDFNMKIVDECGEVYFDQTSQINGENLNAVCNQAEFSIPPLTVYLPGEKPGIHGVTYTITKNLSVNLDAIDDYWCYYMEAACIEEVPSIFNELYAEANFTACSTNENNGLSNGPCDNYKTIMLEDMSPGGQYAAYTFDVITSTYTFTDPLSVLNTSGTGTKFNAVIYKDQLGNPILVQNNAGVNVSPAALPVAEFIQKFQPVWALSLLSVHPEYCYYNSCISLNSPGSVAFDDAMLNTTSFAAAKAAGYFNTVTLGSIVSHNPVLFTGAASASDPYFAASSSAASSMNALMSTYITIGGINLSMWDYAIMRALNCPETGFQNCISKATSDNCSMDYIWLEFRKMYLQAKGNLINQTSGASCPDNCAIGVSGAYAAKTRVWPCWNELDAANPNPADSQADSDAEIAATCNESCTQYADEWLVKLAGCNIPAGILPNVRQDLINLCKSGCSISMPQGFSSDVNGNTIQTILSAYGITETDICTELLITEPELYLSPAATQAQFETSLDVCGCNEIMQARADLQAYLATNPSPALYKTVEEMLAHNTGISIEEVDPLLCACDAVKNNPMFTWSESDPSTQNALYKYFYKIPTALSCKTGACPDCATVQAKISALETRFGSVTLNQSPNYGMILTNYLNREYGKTYTYAQYVSFLQMCNSSSETPYCYENPATKELLNMLTLLAYRGQLTTTSPVDLQTNNAVYQLGQIRQSLPVPGLADYSYSVSGNTVTMNIGEGGNNCSIVIDNTAGIDFKSILSFDMVQNTSPGCSATPTYELQITYLDCGETHTTTLPVTSSCFKFYTCVCSSSGIDLCDVPEVQPEEYCYSQTLHQLYLATQATYQEGVEQAHNQFVSEYTAKCKQAFTTENLNYTDSQRDYQYTLFYYDQAGNLVRTVAPQGVTKLLSSQNAAVNYAREHANDLVPASPVIPTHTFQTTYKYNSYNQLVATTNPDQQGTTTYFYDRYGRIVASQNPEQAPYQYSYVLFDNVGRPMESGQINRQVPPVPGGGSGYTLSPLNEATVKADNASFKNWVYSGTRSEVTITTYDKSLSGTIATGFKSGQQQNLRLRVATVAYFEGIPSPIPNNFFDYGYTSAIHYTYDIHGNVIEQLQDLPELAPLQQKIKSTQYNFELISGNVKKITYQAGERDQFIHTYKYDLVNRLTETFTSPDNYTFSREAHYLYYDYGPLARRELGEQKVQGDDYAYTINGWLKMKNGTALNPLHDGGRDGRTGYDLSNTGSHLNIPADVTAYTLGYFEGDYKAIGNGGVEIKTAGSALGTNSPNLYNGNIRLSTTAIQGYATLGASYRYDQLNRLTSMKAYFNTGVTDGTAQAWDGVAATNAYSSAYSYDRNGNLKTLQRYASSPTTMMDNLTYNYNGGTWNRLNYVTEAAGPAAYDDISNTQSLNNYQYDKIGQLTKDISEGNMEMSWRKGDKKLRKMSRNGNDVIFIYDPFGRRIAKIVKPGATSDKTLWTYTYYVNEANGTTMAVYDIKYATNYVYLREQHIYGAERIGMVQQNKIVYANGTAFPAEPVLLSTNTLGNKRYELTNHLGNVNAVITDRKVTNSNYSTNAYNFDFTSTGQTSWNGSGCGGMSFTLDAGRMRFYPGGACIMTAFKDFVVTPGRSYNVDFDLDRTGIANFTAEIYTAATLSGTGTLITTLTATNGRLSYTLTPAAGQNFIRVYFKKNSGENASFYIDNLQIRTVASPYAAVVIMKSDYYPYGMQMPGRHTNDDKYRYGYNGMEKDAEMHGEGNSYSTEFRQYDPRLGRWLSLDPLMMKYPNMSPYVAFNDNPVYFTDPLGLEGGPPANPSNGEVYTDKNGQQFQYLIGDDGEGSWGSYRGEFQVESTQYKYGLNPDKYYSVGGNGRLTETGMMYNNSLRGSIWTLLLDVHYSNENKKAEQKLQDKINAYHNFRKNLAYNEAVNEYNKSQNIFYLMYEISPFSAIPAVAGEIKNGNYASAIFIGGLEFIPGDDIIKSAKRVLKTSKTGQQVLVGVQALSKKIGRGDEAYRHIKKATDVEVSNIIQSVMEHPDKVLKIERDQSGREIIDIFNPDTKQGIRLDLKTGEFVTFVNYNP